MNSPSAGVDLHDPIKNHPNANEALFAKGADNSPAHYNAAGYAMVARRLLDFLR
jgi:hypothetical protein